MKHKIAANQVWVARASNAGVKTRTQTRRIVSVTCDQICYSTGGDISRYCERAAFTSWIRAYKSTIARPGSAHRLTLKPGARK